MEFVMNKFTEFNSPSYGELSIDEVLEHIQGFMNRKPQNSYRLIIGTDSQTRNRQGADYVLALIVYRVGNGGMYFWYREHDKRDFGLRDRIYKEATMSLEFAQEFMKTYQKKVGETFDLEIHVDVGTVGETKKMIKEVMGMIRGSGFDCKIKPDSYGASSVADKYA